MGIEIGPLAFRLFTGSAKKQSLDLMRILQREGQASFVSEMLGVSTLM